MITVRGRELIIPESERQIGTQYDSNSEVRQIKVSRLTAGGVDISHLDFRLDLRYGNEKKDTALLDKEISDEDIILTWTVGPNSVKEVGTVWIAVRGSDDFGKVKWATNQGYLYVGKTIDTPSGEGVDLTEMEELEKRLDQKTAELDTAEKKRVEAENIREENEQQRLNNEREWQVQGEKAVQAAKDAQAAASAAEKEKTVAMEYATAAGGSADDARQYAEAASTSAVNADASAKRAEEIAEGLGSYDGTAASVTAVDTHNFTGTGAGKKSTVQALLDKIAQKLIEKVVTSDTFQTVLAKYLVNNGLTTEAGKFGLDAAFGKNLQDQITQQNSNLSAVKNKFSNDLFYINSINQRVNDLSVGNASMISDITYMIKDKRIKTGCFGFANRTYSDVPVEVPKWGYVEYFQHADDYVTVRLYADYSTNIWIAQFVLGESKFKIDWVKK